MPTSFQRWILIGNLQPWRRQHPTRSLVEMAYAWLDYRYPMAEKSVSVRKSWALWRGALKLPYLSPEVLRATAQHTPCFRWTSDWDHGLANDTDPIARTRAPIYIPRQQDCYLPKSHRWLLPTQQCQRHIIPTLTLPNRMLLGTSTWSLFNSMHYTSVSDNCDLMPRIIQTDELGDHTWWHRTDWTPTIDSF